MSIGLQFTGRIEHPQALLEAARVLAEERNYHLSAGEGGLKVIMCPLGGELSILWRPGEEPEGPWLVRGGLYLHSRRSGVPPGRSGAAGQPAHSRPDGGG